MDKKSNKSNADSDKDKENSDTNLIDTKDKIKTSGIEI